MPPGHPAPSAKLVAGKKPPVRGGVAAASVAWAGLVSGRLVLLAGPSWAREERREF